MIKESECGKDCSRCSCNDGQDYLHRTMQKEDIYEKLRQNGCRLTMQRKTLIDIIVERECSCCKEIYYIASRKMPKIGLATIYRMINLLEEVGAIRRENLYRICTEPEETETKECVVQLQEGKEIRLDREALHNVLTNGLHACGYLPSKTSGQIIRVL